MAGRSKRPSEPLPEPPGGLGGSKKREQVRKQKVQKVPRLAGSKTRPAGFAPIYVKGAEGIRNVELSRQTSLPEGEVGFEFLTYKALLPRGSHRLGLRGQSAGRPEC